MRRMRRAIARRAAIVIATKLGLCNLELCFLDVDGFCWAGLE